MLCQTDHNHKDQLQPRCVIDVTYIQAYNIVTVAASMSATAVLVVLR